MKIFTALSVKTDKILGRTLTKTEQTTVRRGYGTLQSILAERLCERAGLSITQVGFTIEDIKLFEDILNIQVRYSDTF